MDKGCAACHNGINLGGNSYQPFGVVNSPYPKGCARRSDAALPFAKSGWSMRHCR